MARPVTQKARRRAIVDAAMEEMHSRESSGDITISDVARRLGLTPNAIRYYYRDSEALRWAVRERAETRFMVDRQDSVDQLDDPREKLALLMAAGLPTGADDAEWRTVFRPMMVGRPGPALGELISDVFARQAEIYVGILSEGAASGAFTLVSSAEDIARTLMVMEDYMGFRIVLGDPTFDRADALRLMTQYASLATGVDLEQPQ